MSKTRSGEGEAWGQSDLRVEVVNYWYYGISVSGYEMDLDKFSIV